MKRSKTTWPALRALRSLPLTAALAGLTTIGLTLAACGEAGPAAVSAPPSRAPTAEQAAVTNWLVKTNQMWTSNDFAALDQVTTGQMRALYLSVQRQASLPANASRTAFQLTGLSIMIPCHTGSPTVFVAYADTDVFDLKTGMQPAAMLFQRAGGLWKLATAVTHPGGSAWPALCTTGTPPVTPPMLAPASYIPDLARVLTNAATGAAQTVSMASPFTVNGFLSGPGSIPAQYATWIRQDRQGGVSLTGRFTPAPDPTFALPLADGRGYWVIGTMTQSDTHSAPAGLRARNWPDGSQVATPRPAIAHHQTDTFITTYTAIDPPGQSNATVTLDGFSGWPLTANAS